MESPQFIVIGGANGSGKSTSAAILFPAILPFINADEAELWRAIMEASRYG